MTRGETHHTSRSSGPSQQVLGGDHPFFSSFAFLGWSRSEPWFLEIAHDAQMNWHTEKLFAAVVSGGAFATVARATDGALHIRWPIAGRPRAAGRLPDDRYNMPSVGERRWASCASRWR